MIVAVPTKLAIKSSHVIAVAKVMYKYNILHSSGTPLTLCV